jgi:hypothetical protein
LGKRKRQLQLSAGPIGAVMRILVSRFAPLLAVLVLPPGCAKPAQEGTQAASAATSASAVGPASTGTNLQYQPATWDELAALVRRREPRWIVHTTARRIYVATARNLGYVADEPAAGALKKLLDDVDPSHAEIGIVTYDEIPWPDAARLIDDNLIIWAEQRDGRRVYLHDRTRWLFTLEPAVDDIRRRLEAVDKLIALKFQTHQEIPWRETLALLRADAVRRVAALHGRRVYLTTRDDKNLVSVQPEEAPDVGTLIRDLGSTASVVIE